MSDEETKAPTPEATTEEAVAEPQEEAPNPEASGEETPAPPPETPAAEDQAAEESTEAAAGDGGDTQEVGEDKASVHGEGDLAAPEASTEASTEEAPAEGQVEAEPQEAAGEPEGDGEEKTEEAQTQAGEGEAPADGTEQPAAEGQEATGDEAPAGEGAEEAGSPSQEATEGQEPAAEGAEGEEAAQPADGEAAEGEEGVKEGAEEGAAPTEDGEQPAAEGEATEKPEGEEGAEAAEGEITTIVEEDEESGEPKPPVPQSDTFAEGERPESPVAVGEKLSREGTPTEVVVDDFDQISGSPPVPGTPDRDSDRDSDEEEEEYEEEEDDYEEEEEPQFDREQLIERYHQAVAERQQYQEQNYQLQHKLADYFKKKKSDDNRQEADKNVTDQEQRYLKYMANLDELRRQDAEEREIYKLQIEELKDRCLEKQTKVDDERVKFMEFKRTTAVSSVNSRSGKTIPPKDIEQYLSTENRKEAEVVNVRLENIKLKNKLKKKEHALKSKEELAEGLHLIDFEQLKIENQTYNEKIEERNEELLKLRKKITNTVQVLTHLKEKLQYVQAENQVQQAKLREVEELAARKRDILSRTKQARDALRIDNQKLRQNCGLLGNEPLLRDFEERKDESDDLKQKLDQLKMTHAELTLNLNGVRRKIDQAKLGRV